MFDYYSHLQELSEEKLILELEKLNKRLFKTDPANPMYNQLLNMVDMANDAYNDLIVTARFKNAKDEVLEIGTIESDSSMPDYSREELLNVVVDAYRSDKPKSR